MAHKQKKKKGNTLENLSLSRTGWQEYVTHAKWNAME